MYAGPICPLGQILPAFWLWLLLSFLCDLFCKTLHTFPLPLSSIAYQVVIIRSISAILRSHLNAQASASSEPFIIGNMFYYWCLDVEIRKDYWVLQKICIAKGVFVLHLRSTMTFLKTMRKYYHFIRFSLLFKLKNMNLWKWNVLSKPTIWFKWVVLPIHQHYISLDQLSLQEILCWILILLYLKIFVWEESPVKLYLVIFAWIQ